MSSAGWLGCTRMPSTPRSPIVLRQRVTLRIFAAASTRSLLLIDLGGGRGDLRSDGPPQFLQVGFAGRVVQNEFAKLDRLSGSRRARRLSSSNASAISRLTSSSSGSISGCRTISTSGRSASLRLAATRSRSSRAAIPPTGRRISPRSPWQTVRGGPQTKTFRTYRCKPSHLGHRLQLLPEFVRRNLRIRRIVAG